MIRTVHVQQSGFGPPFRETARPCKQWIRRADGDECSDPYGHSSRKKAIAVRLGITVATAKNHAHGVLRRSGLEWRSAVTAAIPGAAASGEE